MVTRAMMTTARRPQTAAQRRRSIATTQKSRATATGTTPGEAVARQIKAATQSIRRKGHPRQTCHPKLLFKLLLPMRKQRAHRLRRDY